MQSERELLLGLLEMRFSGWWAAFLVHALETLKAFRLYGDDDRQMLAWALALAATQGEDPERPAIIGQGGLSLSEVAAITGIPTETARRHLLRLAQDGQCRRDGQIYAMDFAGPLRVEVAVRARALRESVCTMLGRPPPAPVAGPGAEAAVVGAYLSAGLAYAANLRRRVTRGVFIPCTMAGMLEIEGAVRHRRLLEGDPDESRRRYVEIVYRINWIVIHTARIAQLAGEPMPRARAAVRYASDLGFGTLVSSDHFAYSAEAAEVLRDQNVLIGGVREALADLILISPRPRPGG